MGTLPIVAPNFVIFPLLQVFLLRFDETGTIQRHGDQIVPSYVPCTRDDITAYFGLALTMGLMFRFLFTPVNVSLIYLCSTTALTCW